MELNEDVTVNILTKENINKLKEKFKVKEVKVRKPLKLKNRRRTK